MLPRIEDYSTVRSVAFSFENQILYRMCQEFPSHDDPFVTSGKILAIGRIYAASPERGAGSGVRKVTSLANTLGEHFMRSQLTEKLSEISEGKTIADTKTHEAVLGLHRWFVEEVKACTFAWNNAEAKDDWKPRNHVSFASKYLHFHKPNAFPIMDSFARAGLNAKGFRGAPGNYKSFCRDILAYANTCKQDAWYPRKIDTKLLAAGRRALQES